MSKQPVEKRGNTAWAQCPRCAGWLPVGPALLAGVVKMHCPACHHEFAAADASTVIRPE
jgi:hypothetical protein